MVGLSDLEFLSTRLPLNQFIISQWLHVEDFKNAINEMRANGTEVSPDNVLPIMFQIVNKNSGSRTIDGVSKNTLAKSVRTLKVAIDSKDMDDEWFIKKFGEIYEEVLASRQNRDYVVNPIQMDKFLDLVSFFMHKSSMYDEDFVEIEKNEPKNEFGGVTATFVVFDLRGNDEVMEFCKVLKYCSSVGIDVVDGNMVCISCTVPNVFVKAKKK